MLSYVWFFATPWTYNLPGSSLRGILQARILEWVAIAFSRRSSQPRDRTRVSCIAGRFFTVWATSEACDLIIPLLGVFPLPKLKIFESWDICIPISALFTIAKRWKQHKCPQTNRWIKCSIYLQWNITQPDKRRKFWHMLQHRWSLRTLC